MPVFDGPTFSDYAASVAPGRVRALLEQTPAESLLARPLEDCVRHAFRVVELPQMEYDEKGSQWLPEPGRETLTLRFHVPTATAGDRDRYFTLSPSEPRPVPSSAVLEPPYVVVTGLDVRRIALAAMNALKSNIERLNQDIREGAPLLERRVREKVEAYLDELRAAGQRERIA